MCNGIVSTEMEIIIAVLYSEFDNAFYTFKVLTITGDDVALGQTLVLLHFGRYWDHGDTNCMSYPGCVHLTTCVYLCVFFTWIFICETAVLSTRQHPAHPAQCPCRLFLLLILSLL